MLMKILQYNGRWTRLMIVCLIIIWAMFVRIDRRIKGELAGDERVQVEFMTWPVKAMIQNQMGIIQYPGDYLLIWPFYQIFGNNKMALAFPHLFLTGVGFVLLYFMCLRYFQTIWGYLVTFLVTGRNFNLIQHAGEIRPYPVLVTLGIAGFLVTRRLVKNKNPSDFERLGVSVFIFITMTFHFYGAFILFFNYLFHLICSREDEKWGRVLARNLRHYWPALLLTLPLWAYLTFSSDKSYMKWNPYEYIPQGIVPWLKGVFGNLIGHRKFYFLLAGFVLAMVIPHKNRWAQAVFFIAVILLPIGLIFWSCLNYHYWFIQRLFIWAMPLFAFLLGWQWDSLFALTAEKLRSRKIQ